MSYLVWVGKNGVELLDKLWKVLVNNQIALKIFLVVDDYSTLRNTVSTKRVL